MSVGNGVGARGGTKHRAENRPYEGRLSSESRRRVSENNHIVRPLHFKKKARAAARFRTIDLKADS